MDIFSVIKKDIYSHMGDRTFHSLMRHFKISENDILKMYYFYDSDVYGYGNEIYSNVEIRFVQYLHSQKVGSWHVKKQDMISKWILDINPKLVVDIGYGIVQKYHFDAIENIGRIKFYMLEKYENANEFSKMQIRYIYGKAYDDNFEFMKFDMDNLSGISFLPRGGCIFDARFIGTF